MAQRDGISHQQIILHYPAIIFQLRDKKIAFICPYQEKKFLDLLTPVSLSLEQEHVITLRILS